MMKILRSATLVATMMMTTSPAVAQRGGPNWTSHDNFDARPTLDATRWSGFAFGDGGLDFVRRIQVGELSLRSEGYGPGALGVRAKDTTHVVGLRATVQVDRAITRSCDTDGFDTAVAWVMGARIFRSAAPTPQDATGDVGMYVELGRRSTEAVLGHVMATCRVARCSNADCSDRVDITPPVAMGLVAEDASTLVTVEWNSALGEVRCAAGAHNGRIRYSRTLDRFGPVSDFEGMFIEHAASCPTTDSARSKRTALSAYVDNVDLVVAPPPPANDTCAEATPIDLSSGRVVVTESTVDYYDDYRATGCNAAGAGPDAVFEFTLAQTTNLRISTAGSSFDTVVYLTQATRCENGSAGREVACSDDTPRDLSSFIDARALPAGHYRIVVDGNNATSVGSYTLTVETYR